MTCDCVRMMNEALKERNAVLETVLLGPMAGRVWIQTLPLEKKRGFKAPGIIPQFCPFCGEGYEEQGPLMDLNDRMNNFCLSLGIVTGSLRDPEVYQRFVEMLQEGGGVVVGTARWIHQDLEKALKESGRWKEQGPPTPTPEPL